MSWICPVIAAVFSFCEKFVEEIGDTMYDIGVGKKHFIGGCDSYY